MVINIDMPAYAGVACVLAGVALLAWWGALIVEAMRIRK